MLEKMKALLAETLMINEDDITPESRFKEDLEADSLDLFQIIMGGQELSSLRDHMLKEFEVETDIRNHQSESFGFIGLNSLKDEALKRFGKVYENDKRLAALYVTEHGKPSEAVLGVVTPWDIL